MNTLTQKQIAQIKTITTQTNTRFHGNTKKVGSLPVQLVKEIVLKKAKRDRLHCRGMYASLAPFPKSPVQIVKHLIAWSLECKGTGYFKVMIEGNTGIYYASPAYGHRDYNKSRLFDKTPKTLKLLQLFNTIVTRNN